jgi:hypothetical protein
MKIRYWITAGFMAGLLALVGCGTEDDAYTVNESYEDEGMMEDETAFEDPMAPSERADETLGAEDEGVFGAEDEGLAAGDEGMMGDEDTMGMDQEVDMTEFAALDTDSDGALTEQEWQPDAMEAEFSEADADGDGMVTEEEFQNVAAAGGNGMSMGQSTEAGQTEGQDTQ